MKKLVLLVPAAVLLAVSAWIWRPANAAQNGAGGDSTMKLEDVAKLTVRGEAQLDKPADRMRMSIGVISEGDQANDVLRDNSAKMERVIQAIERVGLTEDEYETGQFSIRPVQSRRPRNADEMWKPKILGYEVVNTIHIETDKIDLAGDIIEAGNSAGANSVAMQGFVLSNPRQYRDEAIRVATANAIADANSLADAASVRLVRIININVDHTPVHRPEMGRARMMAADAGGGAPPISAGDVAVRAGVTIVYEIEGSD